jgi:hypothetical protein
MGEIATIGTRKIVDKVRGIEKTPPDYRQIAMNMMAISLEKTVEIIPILETDDEVFLGDIDQQVGLDIAA